MREPNANIFYMRDSCELIYNDAMCTSLFLFFSFSFMRMVRTLESDMRLAARLVQSRHTEIVSKNFNRNMPCPALKARNRQLELEYKKFRVARKKLARSLGLNEIQPVLDLSEKVNQWYFEAVGILVEAIERKQAGTQSGLNDSFSQGIIRVETARRPEPGKFDGDPSKWLAFRDRFIAEVDQKEQIDEVTKLIYLQEACTDRALDILGEWQPIAVNYKKAWKSLVDKFDDEYRIQQSLAVRLVRMKAEKSESYVALRRVIDTTVNTLRQLEAMKVKVCEWDVILCALVLDRLPRSSVDAWEQKRDIKKPPTFNDLIEFLESRARGCANTEENVSSAMPLSAKDQNRAGAIVQGSSTRVVSGMKCKFCGSSNHPLFRCAEFLALPVKERANVVKKWNHCIKCLRFHQGKCSEPGCTRCPNPNHNSVLCFKSENSMRRVNTGSEEPKRSHELRAIPYQKK